MIKLRVTLICINQHNLVHLAISSNLNGGHLKKAVLIICLIYALHLSATVINIPTDQPTIQDGINAAVNGDTVLVQPGDYHERINFNGKNITVASLFFTTQDTTYITQTIIDGDSLGCVVKIENGENLEALFCGFSVINGNGENDNYRNAGGGIYCNNSSPSLRNLILYNNQAIYGGGIYCEYSNPSLENISLSHNYGSFGGGLWLGDSNPDLKNIAIFSNSSGWAGSGIWCQYSSPNLENISVSNNHIVNSNLGSRGGGIVFKGSTSTLKDVTITSNSAIVKGGGVYCTGSNLNFENVLISNNNANEYGGGIYSYGSSLNFVNVSVTNNSASNHGGGIYCFNSSINFSFNNRSSIHSNIIENVRGFGSDIFTEDCDLIHVIVDTFTVMDPTGYYASPMNDLTFDILSSVEDNINADIYVDVNGTNDNSGLSPDSPFKTINHALQMIYADSLNIHTIYLSPGIYSNASNGESFPIHWSNYVNLSGASEVDTVLDAEGTSEVMIFENISNANIGNITIKNAVGNTVGGGISCFYSNPNFVNMTIRDNINFVGAIDYEYGDGGGITCYYSNPILQNVLITGNHAYYGGGIYCKYSNPILENVIISNNTSHENGFETNDAGQGGGIYCRDSNPHLDDVIITNNYAHEEGGGLYITQSNPSLHNVLITDNVTEVGGGIYLSTSSPSLVNVTIADNYVSSGGGGIACRYNSNPSLLNVLIVNNTSNYIGGGVCCNDGSSPSLVNVTIANNTASSYGGGMQCVGNSNPTLLNCVLWNDSPQEIYLAESGSPCSLTISYSDIYGGEAGIVTNNNGTVNWLTGNIDPDPIFVGYGDQPFALQDISPCINTGIVDTTGLFLPEFDLAGNLRVFGGRIDMGAYENQNVIAGAYEDTIPEMARIIHNYPNPFNPSTTISWENIDIDNTELSLNIYNIKGQKVKSFTKLNSINSIIWDGRNDISKPVASGIYFYNLRAGTKVVASRKCVLLK